MTKKIYSVLLLVAVCFCALFSCTKSSVTSSDPTLNYFPLKLGKYVTYNVDSVYYYGSTCTQYEVKSQMKTVITDTFTDSKKRLSYIMDVFTRPYEGGTWVHNSVIFITPTVTPPLTLSDPTTISLLYNADQTQYVKMIFPVSNGYSWAGNKFVTTQDSMFTYLKDWVYSYQNYHMSYNNGYINFDNTVTVSEDNESVNYPNVDSSINAYRTFAREVYAYNVGMVYKEWTHWTYKPWLVTCKDGYSVVMQAIDHN